MCCCERGNEQLDLQNEGNRLGWSRGVVYRCAVVSTVMNSWVCKMRGIDWTGLGEGTDRLDWSGGVVN